MPTPIPMSELNKRTYSDNIEMVRHLIRSPLRDAVTTISVEGEIINLGNFFGENDYRVRADGDRRLPDDPPPTSRRWLARPEVIDSGVVIDKTTIMDLAMDPTSPLIQTRVDTCEKGVHDRIMGIYKRNNGTYGLSGGGILGGAKEGKNGEISVPFPTAQYVPAAGTGLTLAKMMEVRERASLVGDDLTLDTGYYMAITGREVTDLLSMVTAAGSTLNLMEQEQLKSGRPTPILGFTYVMTNRVATKEDGTRLLPVWRKRDVIAAFWQDIQGQMWRRTDMPLYPYAYADVCVDAARVRDENTFVIESVG